jgi:AcrR family transcriptional regulator
MTASTKATIDLQRTELLDAAAFLFATKGFHATGMRELARQLNIKAGSLYYHISSKDQLLNEVCEIGLRSLASNIDHSAANNHGLPETIRSIVIGHTNLLNHYGSYLNCYQNEYVHLTADVREKLRLELITFHHKIDDVFKRAITNGETHPELVVKNARLALIAILHQLSRLGTEHPQTNMETTAEGLSAILIHGLARRSAGSAGTKPPPSA